MDTKISKNCIKGNLITSLDEIVEAANNNESLYHSCWGRKPAKVYIMMQMNSIAVAVTNKQIYKVINLNPVKYKNNGGIENEINKQIKK